MVERILRTPCCSDEKSILMSKNQREGGGRTPTTPVVFLSEQFGKAVSPQMNLFRAPYLVLIFLPVNSPLALLGQRWRQKVTNSGQISIFCKRKKFKKGHSRRKGTEC